MRKRVARVLWFLDRLDAGARVTAPMLAAQFGVTVRTAYRDLDAMRDDWRVPMAYSSAGETWALTGELDGLLRRLAAWPLSTPSRGGRDSRERGKELDICDLSRKL